MAAACATTSSSSMRRRSMMSSANCQAGTLARLATVGEWYKVDSLRTVIGLHGGLYTTRTWSVRRFELCY